MPTYPLAFPSTKGPARISFRAVSVVGVQHAELTLEQTVYAWGGDRWEADIECPPMKVANAEPWVSGLLLALNGAEGTFLMGPADAGLTVQQGTWTGGSPLADGAVAAGVKTMDIDGLSAGATGKAGDWFQLGTGSSRTLHKLTQDFTANGSGEATIEFWPATRAAVANNDALTLATPKGLWRLASSVREWSVERAGLYGIRFACIEARD